MKSVGEIMSIGRSFSESIQKGFASLEYGLDGLDTPPNKTFTKDNIISELKPQSSQRLLVIGEALRLGVTKKEIKDITKYDPWFIDEIESIVDLEKIIKNNKLNKELLFCLLYTSPSPRDS